MNLDRAVTDARAALGEWFPDCRAAWLGGSVVRGVATPGSDLDVTVLLDGPPAPFRDSRRYAAWPVELFVHSEASLEDYTSRDVAERRPTLPRLVGESVVIADRDGSGARWQRHCRELLLAGPAPLADDERSSLRYAVTDLLDDLGHSRDVAERLATATLLAEEAQRLLLLGERHWVGRGKWLTRELADLDDALGAQWVSRFTDGLVSTANGDIHALAVVCGEVLDRNGGPLFEGHRLGGRLPAARSDGPPEDPAQPAPPQSRGSLSPRPTSARTSE